MTYSIIGRDPGTGEIGIGVQSRWFHAAQDLAWIEPGVGAVCTQAFLEPSYGQRGIELLRAGRTPAQALDELLSLDEGRDSRQVAIADADGHFEQHTGSACVLAAGHGTGRDCCAQGNMLASEGCWDTMIEAFESTEGALTDRLLAALEAAEREGGDARGRQSAGILVRPARSSGLPWQDRVLELGVVDHPDPVSELRRLLAVKRAYDALDRAIDLVGQGDLAAAAEQADAAQALAPADDQITFWRATMLAGAGRVEEAQAAWRDAVAAHPGWPDFLRRCIDAGLVPAEVGALVDGDRPS
jgi:uncharacterized Ntn-hydrolase superfamily protein